LTALSTYIPQDRLRALARGETLPSRTSGSALFVDISGFTALTESLHQALGPRRGAEELTRRIEGVYSGLITQIELFGGNVIGFAGDSMLCWFDDDLSLVADGELLGSYIQPLAAYRALACGVALQRAMRAFANIVLPDRSTTALTLKVAIATGTARRFVVGDPKIQLMDALAGTTVARTATAEHLAQKGDVIIDEATANVLGDHVMVQEWREDSVTRERFVVIAGLAQPIDPPVLMQLDTGYIVPEELYAWVHAPLVERDLAGQVSFITEFRPCVVMFVRFVGIDYDQDPAGVQLDQFIGQLQTIAVRHGGTLLQLTIGDKGSYAYVNFGIFSAHEDDTRRAVSAAVELRQEAQEWGFLQPLQIGITHGTLRVGAYGGLTRKTFGALGDEVNLAARLMTNAAPGEILLSSHVHKAVEQYFVFEPRPPVPMKGKAEPVPIFALTAERKQRAVRLQEPNYALPMVGRQAELQIIDNKLDLTLADKSQVIGIVAEAGMGKSRLVAEVIRLAHKKGFVGYGGACQSDAVNTPYLAWKSIWSAFFDIDPAAPLKRQMRSVENLLEEYAPERLQAMPLLNAVLDAAIPENEFTSSLEPQHRKSVLTALFEDCLRLAAQDEPVLIVVEDVHWIDALSHDLLEDLSKALADCPLCFVLAYRPPQITRLQAPRLEALRQFTKIELHELNQAEAELAILAKLAQLYPARTGAVRTQLVEKLMSRSQGNPFFLEELLNYLRDRGLDPRDPADLERIELPDSLHALVLSRIDQLSEREKTTLRVASIVGRLFRAAWLTGYYPALGDVAHVKLDLDKLHTLDITPLDSEPELAYLFKHIVTHEVTYESLPFGLRAQFHEQLARYLERQIADGAMLETALLDTLVFHYTRSENKAKQREYLRKAGEAAQRNFANDAALEYYGQLLPLLRDEREQIQIHLQRGQVLELLGGFDEAEADYRAALEIAEQAQADVDMKASAQYALGKLYRLRGEFPSALDWLSRAREARRTMVDAAGLAQVLIETGFVLFRKGEYEQAREALKDGLALAREVGDPLTTGKALNNLGAVAFAEGDFATARGLFEESLALQREARNKAGISSSLNNLGLVAQNQGDYTAARALYQQSLALDREMGDKWGSAITLGNLGAIAYFQGNYATARELHEENLVLRRTMGDKYGIAVTIGDLGLVALSQSDYDRARAFFEESLGFSREMGLKDILATVHINLGHVAYYLGDYAQARALYEEGQALSKEMASKSIIANALLAIGLVGIAEHSPEAREKVLNSLRLRQEMGEQLPQTSSLIGLAALALQEGNARRAAQLLGAVDSALKILNASVEGEILPFHTQTLAAVRERLGEPAFQSAWEEGSKWSLEETVRNALQE
jgi:class 3 adenylate cyclase/predicted ATPase